MLMESINRLCQDVQNCEKSISEIESRILMRKTNYDKIVSNLVHPEYIFFDAALCFIIVMIWGYNNLFFFLFLFHALTMIINILYHHMNVSSKMNFYFILCNAFLCIFVISVAIYKYSELLVHASFALCLLSLFNLYVQISGHNVQKFINNRQYEISELKRKCDEITAELKIKNDILSNMSNLVMSVSEGYQCITNIYEILCAKINNDSEMRDAYQHIKACIATNEIHRDVSKQQFDKLQQSSLIDRFIGEHIIKYVTKQDINKLVKLKQDYIKLLNDNNDILNSECTYTSDMQQYYSIDEVHAIERELINKKMELLKLEIDTVWNVKVYCKYVSPKGRNLHRGSCDYSLKLEEFHHFLQCAKQKTHFDVINDFDRDAKRVADYGQRQRILRRDNFTCQLCGNVGKGYRDPQGRTPEELGLKTYPLEIDHKLPFSQGGTTSDDNLWTLCRPCNQGKLNKYDDSNM